MLARRVASGRGVRAVAAMSQEARFIVAKIKDNQLLPSTLTLEWTYEVYTELGDAQAELLDAISVGLSGHRVYELRLQPVLMALTPPSD